ncbi:hypothetical protein P1P68_05785 [Streptomyces scabiei]|nr:hypothetical protein [Streptomyces scabiei]MDW8804314.1 hypothetical protein [Streptomyces scabiei]
MIQVGEDLRAGNPPRQLPADPGAPLPAPRLRTLLAGTSRKLTADRAGA